MPPQGKRKLTPNSTGKGDKDTESLGVVLRALIGLHTLQDSDHNRQNNYLSC